MAASSDELLEGLNEEEQVLRFLGGAGENQVRSQVETLTEHHSVLEYDMDFDTNGETVEYSLHVEKGPASGHQSNKGAFATPLLSGLNDLIRPGMRLPRDFEGTVGYDKAVSAYENAVRGGSYER